MAVLLSPVGGAAAQFLDNNGNPLLAGKLYTYVAGTTTNQAVYTSSSGVTPHTNPIILDAGGRVPGGEIWLTDGLQYKFVLKNANDVLIGTYDNLVGINSNFVNFLTETEVQTATAGQTVFTLTTMQYQPGTNNLSVFVDGVNQIDGATYSYVETSSTVVTFTTGLHVGALVKFTTAQTLSTGVTDASLVTYTPVGTGAVATNVQTKLRESVSVMDFMTAAQIANVLAGTTDTTLTAAIQNGIDWCDANGRNLHFPSGQYSIDVLTILDTEYNFSMSCDGAIFHGIATVPRNGMIDIRNAVDFDMFGKWRLHADGNTNYTAAFSIKAQTGGSVQTTTRVNIYGLMCYNALQAVHVGDYDYDKQCSEINFFGCDSFVCPVGLYLGGANTLASFNGCNLCSEPSPNFPGAFEATVWQEGGVVNVVGGEFLLAASANPTTVRGILFSPSKSVTYGNAYGLFRLSSCHSEVSAQFLHIENVRALSAPISNGSTVLITGSGGYVTDGIGAVDYFSIVDATYAGNITVNNCNFYTGSARSAYNIASASTLVDISCDKKSFGINFKNWIAGVTGGKLIHDLQPLVNAHGISATITGATTLKFNNNDVTGVLARYGPNYNTTTGVYTSAYEFTKIVISITIIGTGVAADLFLKRNGTIVAFGSYNAATGVGQLNATLWNITVGTTVEVILQPVSPATFDGSVWQSLQISGDTD